MAAFGYDYGTKPLVMLVGNTSFPDLLTTEKFAALVYDQIPEFGLLVNPPRLTMVFSNMDTGRRCFTLFKQWSGPAEDGDAVRISFIEFKDGSYGMCISQDVDRLIDRVVPGILRDEVELKIMNVGHIRTFSQQSKGYKWFKSIVAESPFVLAPQEKRSAPLRELAIRKRKVNFFQEDDVPEHSIEKSLLEGRDSKKKYDVRKKTPSEIRLRREGIYERRRKQMSKFFPVTLERLNFNKDFLMIKELLIGEEYQEWQIIQAACNISLKYSAPELLSLITIDRLRVIRFR